MSLPSFSSSQAFAWFSDLLVEHAEIFWSLFAVDMDGVLSMQPSDTWDSFPLFQLLNDYLRTDGKFRLQVISLGKMSQSMFSIVYYAVAQRYEYAVIKHIWSLPALPVAT